jgi:hypothetical protein
MCAGTRRPVSEVALTVGSLAVATTLLMSAIHVLIGQVDGERRRHRHSSARSGICFMRGIF